MFYRCSATSSHLFRCPDGLGFDPETATCDNEQAIGRCQGGKFTGSHGKDGDTKGRSGMSNWRGEMSIRTIGVPVFAARKASEDEERQTIGYEENLTHHRSEAGEEKTADRPSKTSDDDDGMGIFVNANEDDIAARSRNEAAAHAYDEQELTRIQIWPSSLPALSGRPSRIRSGPSLSPPSQRAPSRAVDAKQLPTDNQRYRNVDIVHSPDQQYAPFSRWGGSDEERLPPLPPVLPFAGQEEVRGPEGTGQQDWRHKWLIETGGIAIAIDSKYNRVKLYSSL